MRSGNEKGWIASRKVVASLIVVVFVKSAAIAFLVTAGSAPVLGPSTYESTADDRQLDGNTTDQDDVSDSETQESSDDGRRDCSLCLPAIGSTVP